MASAQVENGFEDGWTKILSHLESHHRDALIYSPLTSENLADRIHRIPLDLAELQAFYTVPSSHIYQTRLSEFFKSELDPLLEMQDDFDSMSRDGQADFLLLKNWLTHQQRKLQQEAERNASFADFVEPFAEPLKSCIKNRMQVGEIDAMTVAGHFEDIKEQISVCRELVQKNKKKYTAVSGYRAARTVEQLHEKLREMHGFYSGYNPMWDWWVKGPFEKLSTALSELPAFFMENLAGVRRDDEDTIVGEPIGKDALLAEFEAEMIPYSPEELIRIAQKHYQWCEKEMIKASSELGFGDDWQRALEHVKTLFEQPDKQPVFIKGLINDGLAYVKTNDLVTVPRVAEEAMRMVMIEPAKQRVSPFFLGGKRMQVSYPTSSMDHSAKLMSMRGNNRHFSKATACHEMIPGHHLQLFLADRVKPYRKLFENPFYVEGWALYWELVFWDRGDFFTSPEDRIGSLFWRMHRCARVVFSLNFHLGKMTPKECVDLLVNWVGHERTTAEGEVRRSVGEDYSPLYQSGYLLGALQLWKLREEVLVTGKMREKEFHDKVLACNMIPIEMARALILEQELSSDWKSHWRFFGDV